MASFGGSSNRNVRDEDECKRLIEPHFHLYDALLVASTVSSGCAYGVPIAKLNSKGAAAMSDDLNMIIGYQVQSTAEWRRDKARQFPDDARNLRAAEQLEQLAAQIEKLEDSDIHQRVADIHDRFTVADDGDGWLTVGEDVSAELRAIGFHSGYETGEQFLEWYCGRLEEGLRSLIEDKLAAIDDAVPAPDLSEQAANDPAVKAAKQAYDEAFAKAYAEARKKNT
jgi:hypothetical protein